jgi:hypothetical protein
LQAGKPYPGPTSPSGFRLRVNPGLRHLPDQSSRPVGCIDELFAKDMGIRQFARDVVRPHLALNYAGYSFQAVGDPSGNAGKDTEEKTCFMELAEEGIPCCPATSNNFVARREAVAKYLTRMSDGKPVFNG